jgi:hypothetical protein
MEGAIAIVESTRQHKRTETDGSALDGRLHAPSPGLQPQHAAEVGSTPSGAIRTEADAADGIDRLSGAACDLLFELFLRHDGPPEKRKPEGEMPSGQGRKSSAARALSFKAAGRLRRPRARR